MFAVVVRNCWFWTAALLLKGVLKKRRSVFWNICPAVVAVAVVDECCRRNAGMRVRSPMSRNIVVQDAERGMSKSFMRIENQIITSYTNLGLLIWKKVVVDQLENIFVIGTDAADHFRASRLRNRTSTPPATSH